MQNPTLPQVGDVIADKYRIERVLGEGGMGIVYQAVHAELLQRVAIKVLLPHVANHRTAAERFRREARAAAAMRGEHVCRVLDVGTLHDELPFMVMEFLEGRDLAEELRQGGPLSSTEAVDYVLQACEALAEAHGSGIVHRDLKPANLFLTQRSDGSRRIKVLDFGVSKALSDDSAGEFGLTNTSTMIGSPLYMSPEQLDSARSVDGRTDIWALGVVMYELLCGVTPFGGTSIPQLVSAVLHDEPVPLSTRGIGVPLGLEHVIDQALAKNRDYRFASVVDLAKALTPYGTAASSQAASRAARVLSLSAAGASTGADSYRDRQTMTQMTSTHPTAGPSGWSGKTSTPVSGAEGTPMGWQREEKRSAASVSRMVGAGAVALALLGAGYFWMSQQDVQDVAVDPASPETSLSSTKVAPTTSSANIAPSVPAETSLHPVPTKGRPAQSDIPDGIQPNPEEIVAPTAAPVAAAPVVAAPVVAAPVVAAPVVTAGSAELTGTQEETQQEASPDTVAEDVPAKETPEEQPRAPKAERRAPRGQAAPARATTRVRPSTTASPAAVPAKSSTEADEAENGLPNFGGRR